MALIGIATLSIVTMLLVVFVDHPAHKALALVIWAASVYLIV